MYKKFGKDDNLCLVFSDVNNMKPGSSLLLPKEAFLLDSKNDTARKEESENAVVDFSDVNANSVRNRSYAGNDT